MKMDKMFLFILLFCESEPLLYSSNSNRSDFEVLKQVSLQGESPFGQLLKDYRDSVREQEIPCSPNYLSRIWSKMSNNKNNEIRNEKDFQLVSAEELKRHAEYKKAIYDNSPWKKNVPLDNYQKYILPYRASNEMQDFIGDSLLRAEYSYLVESIKDPIEVFKIISRKVFETMRECKSACPYTLDAYTINYIHQVTCEQRCVLLVHILRQFGIPCCIDRIPFWGNYSTVGHAWVVLVYNGKNYIYEDTSDGGVVHETSTGVIDAALFPLRYIPDSLDCYPYSVQNEKLVTKVIRKSYTEPFLLDTILGYNQQEDVSAYYGYLHSIVKTVDVGSSNGGKVYLCAFHTGANWKPVDCSEVNNDRVYFNNVNLNLLYIVAKAENRRLVPICNPFLGKDADSEWSPSQETKKIICRRKYPIFSHWLNQWGNMKGSVFEVSNDADFSMCDTIGMIETMPFGWTRIELRQKNKEYRYFRYHASNQTRTPLAELHCTVNGQIIKGRIISQKVKNPSAVFDNDEMSICDTKQTGYWIGMDFGTPQKIDDIDFLAKNDGNDIVFGHRYELYFFDRGWKSLGNRIAINNELKFWAPANSIFLLRDLNSGVEIRPFSYNHETNTQIWY